MYILRSVLVFCLLMQLGYLVLATEWIKANYLTVKAAAEKNPQMAITFTDARIVDENTIKGTFYYQDSDMNALSSPYEAMRK